MVQVTQVKDGRVDYSSLDRAALHASLRTVARTDLAALGGNEQYAFLINAYNLHALALAKRQLADAGRSLRHPLARLRFFLLSPVVVGGARTSLFRLEFQCIRPHLRRDPRGHFALVCASKGCPPLRNGVYHGERLDEELEQAGRSFVTATSRLDGDTLWLSRIFKWYRRDFDDLHEVYAHYTGDRTVLTTRPTIRFLPYDWDLNA